MIFIKIGFPAGRWHATAWGSHVNEGIPEWPPCPWRLCRALIAAWHWKVRQDKPILCGLIDKLAAQLPDFFLPEASASHLRHYMPVTEAKREARTKVFDTFVQITSGKCLWIRWNVDLSPQEQSLLGMLLCSLNYLGRAESLVCASLEATPPTDIPPEQWTTPSEKSRLSDGEPIRLLAPQLPPAYAAWAKLQETAGPRKAKRKPAATTTPESLFLALQLDTADWKSEGWSIPPGARWAEYLRPRDCFKLAPRAAGRSESLPRPCVARFAVVCAVPPSITQSLSLAERFHQALCAKIGRSDHSTALTGRTQEGEPLKGHGHVFFLPECDKHGYITHVTLHAPTGFDEAACQALGKLRKVWGAEGFDVKTVLLALGQPEDFFIASPYFHKSKTWVSLTPFIPVRHPKATRSGTPKIDPLRDLQVGSPEHDCWRLLEATAPTLQVAAVQLQDEDQGGTRISTDLRRIPCLDFQRHRRTGGGIRASGRGFALRVELRQAQSLPFGVGYGAHFGLGLFAPVD